VRLDPFSGRTDPSLCSPGYTGECAGTRNARVDGSRPARCRIRETQTPKLTDAPGRYVRGAALGLRDASFRGAYSRRGLPPAVGALAATCAASLG
jgi:hypothetical protein